MIYQGKAFKVLALESGIAELRFDLEGESVNKFNRLAIEDLNGAVQAIKADDSIKGVVLTSGKEGVFIVGADIKEFTSNFRQEESEL
ncbi:enoyl-CoA hydratase-related protein, partial [Endozoicomonas sp. SESOKO3]